MEIGLAAMILKYGGIAALVILLGERVARITPNETDDKIIMYIRKLARIIGLDLPNVDSVNAKTPTESDK
jgi:hypothetical protein